MKTNEQGNSDEALRRVLKEWRTDAPLPPGFQQSVWFRIERSERAPVSIGALLSATINHLLGRMLSRPGYAVAYVAVLLVIGATAGWIHAGQETHRVKNELGERYVRLMDPYQAPRE